MSIRIVRPSTLLAGCFLTFFCLSASAEERCTIVKVWDEIGEEQELVMTDAEIQALQASIQEDARFYMLAMARAEQQWKAAGKAGIFPRTAINQRRFQRSSSHSSREEAMTIINRRQERAAEKAKKEAEAQKQVGSDPKADKREQARLEKQKALEEALDLYKKALAELRQEAAEKAKKSNKP